MSMAYDAAPGAEILKLTIWPTLTLTSVANPWIVDPPAPLISKSLSPVFRFSQAIGFGPQGASCANAAIHGANGSGLPAESHMKTNSRETSAANACRPRLAMIGEPF